MNPYKADLHVHSSHSNKPTYWTMRKFSVPESYTSPKHLYRVARERAVLQARVEVLCPVETPSLAREIRAILDVHLQDSRSAWDMQPDGSYVQRISTDPDIMECSSHSQLIEHVEKRIVQYRKRMKKRGATTNIAEV